MMSGNGVGKSDLQVGSQEVVEIAQAVAEVALVLREKAGEQVGGDCLARREEAGDDFLQQFRRGAAVDQGGEATPTVGGDDQAAGVLDRAVPQ